MGDQKKRMVIPQALKVLRMKSHRNFCSMGDLASITGWTKQDIVSKLEDKRKEKSAAFHEQKEKKVKARCCSGRQVCGQVQRRTQEVRFLSDLCAACCHGALSTQEANATDWMVGRHTRPNCA